MFVLMALTLLVLPSVAMGGGGSKACTTIQDGVLTYSPGHYLQGEPLMVGYDPYGYNYQAHMFKGSYANGYLGAEGFPPYEGDDEAYLAENPAAANKWYWPYRDVNLIMKWNDAWLSNKDCGTQVGEAQYTDLTTPDGRLDRHYPIDSYIGSGAWLTNHQSGEYEGEDGETCKWNYLLKIVAAPADAFVDEGIWYAADGAEIGPVIWGAFAIVQQVENDACAGIHGLQYKAARPGLGNW